MESDQKQLRTVDWSSVAIELNALFYSERDGTRQWAASLEDYEILFPETRACRIELLDRQAEIQRYVFDFSVAFASALLVPPETRPSVRRNAITDFEKHKDLLLDQLALVEDLRIHLQNRSLGAITGAAVPDRRPAEAGRPVLVSGDMGQLEIVPFEARE